jgi:hypothetical protein
MPTQDMVVAGAGLIVFLLLCVALFLRGRDSGQRSIAEELERRLEQAQEEQKQAYRRADDGNAR